MQESRVVQLVYVERISQIFIAAGTSPNSLTCSASDISPITPTKQSTLERNIWITRSYLERERILLRHGVLYRKVRLLEENEKKFHVLAGVSSAYKGKIIAIDPSPRAYH